MYGAIHELHDLSTYLPEYEPEAIARTGERLPEPNGGARASGSVRS